MRRSMDYQIARLHKEHNTLAYVHKLPTELLVYIFRLSLVPLPDYCLIADFLPVSPHIMLDKLMIVCSIWKELVHNSPSLWSEIRSSDSKRLITKVLEKSKEHPLMVTLSGPVEEEERPGYYLNQEFIREAGKHIHRWRQADLCLWDGEDLVVEPLQTAAPALERMELLVLHDASTRTLDLFRGEAPRLEHISFQGIALRDWSSPIFAGLHHLSIVSPSVTQPSLQQVLGMLRSSPQLTFVRLSNFRGQSNEGHDGDATFPVVLQHLKSLALKDLPPTMLESLLAQIRIPRRCTVSIFCEYEDEQADFTLGSSIHHLLPGIDSNLLQGRAIKLSLGPSTFLCHGRHPSGYDDLSFHVYVTGMASAKPLRWLASTLGVDLMDKPVTVRLEGGSNLADEEVISGLRSLPYLTDLRVDEEVDNVERFIVALSRPTPVDGRSTWLLPQLQRLSINMMDLNPFSVLRMVEGRYGASSIAGSEHDLPQPFTRLKLRMVEDNVSKEIFRIIGRNNLVIGGEYGCYDDDDEEYEDEDLDLGDEPLDGAGF